MSTSNISEIQMVEGSIKTEEEIALEKIPVLESEIALCKSDNERLEHQIDKLKEQRDAFEEKLHSQSVHIKMLSSKVKELTNVAKELDEVILELKNKLDGKPSLNQPIPENEFLYDLINSYMIMRNIDGIKENKRFTLKIYKLLASAGYNTKSSLKNATFEDLCDIKGINKSKAKSIIQFANNNFKTIY